MIKVPGEGARSYVPPPITPKEGPAKSEETKLESQKIAVPTPKEGFTKGPEFDSQALAVRMAALAMDAKEKELSFGEIIQEAIRKTGLKNPQAALEKANKELQKDIEEKLEEIKKNKDLMDETESWQAFAQILQEELSEEQVQDFLGTIKESIKELKT